ncbi:MAG: hypothetical protein HY900_11420 [Deltaproteobacteria bacterium]|nr:hypothetical protein [Deltaproteobacteria bacterium]
MTPAPEIHDLSLRESIGDFVTFHVRSDELAEGVRLLDRVGFASIDAFGGTTFLPTMKVLGEDPWQRLRGIRRAVTHTPLQAVLRGRLVFSARPAPPGTIRAALAHLRDIGVDRIKVADIGLDLLGARDVVAMAKDEGFHVTPFLPINWGKRAEACRSLTEAAAEYAAAGADAIGVQDPFGVLNPIDLGELVRAAEASCPLPLRLHLHDANFLAVAGVQAAFQAGAAAADTTISALAWAYSPPHAEAVVMALRGGPWDPGIDLGRLEEASVWFEGLKARKGFLYRELYGVDHGALRGELPVGVRRALEDELRERGRTDLAEAAWKEVPNVWEALGKPPFLNPLVRAVCSQAIDNVLAASPFTRLEPKVAAYLRGDYGPPPPETQPDLIARAREEETSASAFLPNAEELDAEDFGSEDDRLTYAMFPQIAEEFFRLRESGGAGSSAPEMYSTSAEAGAPLEALIPRRLTVKRQGEAYEVVLEGMGPKEWGKRSFFLRIGGQVARLDVVLPAPDAPPLYTVHHHGHRHQVEFVDVLAPGRESVPVLLKEDGHLREVLFSFPHSL